ncbi:MAG: methyl-accepting chemotaxis protein [Lachnospiraceae bacterium]
MKQIRSSLKSRIWLSVILLVGIILLQGTASIILQNKIKKENENLISHKDMVTEVVEILVSHHDWLSGMLMYVYTGDEFTGSLDYETCSLGEWLHSDYILNNESAELKSLLSQIHEPHKIIHENAATLVTHMKNGTISPEKSSYQFTNVIKPNSLVTIDLLRQIVDYQEQKALNSEKALTQLSVTVGIMNIAVIIAATAVGLLIGISLIREVIPPIEAITRAARSMATGDTDITLNIKSQDEIGQLGTAFQTMVAATTEQAQLATAVADGNLTHNLAPRSDQDHMVIALNSMTARLKEMFEAILFSAQQVNAAANQLAAGAQSLAEGSTEQSAAVEQMATSLDGVAVKAMENTRTAKKAADISTHLLDLAEHGSAQMKQLDLAMHEINQSSKKVNQVVKVIDDLAFQTNILALNAAVEAAHVGDYGKGFTVVAREIRSLAVRCTDAAKEVAELIDESIAKADDGFAITQETGDSIVSIVQDVQETSRIIQQIAEASNDQSVALSEISSGVAQVSIVVQRNSLTAEQAASAAEELSSQANSLNRHVDHFKLDV